MVPEWVSGGGEIFHRHGGQHLCREGGGRAGGATTLVVDPHADLRVKVLFCTQLFISYCILCCVYICIFYFVHPCQSGGLCHPHSELVFIIIIIN